MTDPDIATAVNNALRVVEAADEPWLYRYAAQSLLDAGDTTSQCTLHKLGAVDLLVYDRAEPEAWIQSPAKTQNVR